MPEDTLEPLLSQLVDGYRKQGFTLFSGEGEDVHAEVKSLNLTALARGIKALRKDAVKVSKTLTLSEWEECREDVARRMLMITLAGQEWEMIHQSTRIAAMLQAEVAMEILGYVKGERP